VLRVIADAANLFLGRDGIFTRTFSTTAGITMTRDGTPIRRDDSPSTKDASDPRKAGALAHIIHVRMPRRAPLPRS
jgi:hypothetical protein